MKYLTHTFLLKLLLLLFWLSPIYMAQTKTNFEVCIELIDSIFVNNEVLLKGNIGNTYSLSLVPEFTVFSNEISSNFSSMGINRKLSDGIITNNLNFVIKRVGVNYSEPEKSGLFGKYSVERKVVIEGSVLREGAEVKEVGFKESFTDTVPFDKINELEDNSLSFTRGNIPEPPFFSSIIEPIIVVASAAATVYLFFTVRSK